ncbi:ER membrane protein complex subunit 1 isoform X2 [Schistocerca serialis cubense]|uniref:ER membrane protein complex subunit 1 isoform X2 n=1 Tax=Schistocerca serialis cubense TaxID=2023355 RepID=UPI00214ECD7B|nr:ER membrane protein complex subunit 1 isoform X2 [Schistocerca serialis cubense]
MYLGRVLSVNMVFGMTSSYICSSPCKILFCLVVTAVFGPSSCLYEDQIGKFDWKQSYVGKLKFAEFDVNLSLRRIFVATEENVVAALNSKSGQILWRQVLEKGGQGDIHFLGVDGSAVVTVSGDKVLTLRGWDQNAGYLLWEWPLPLQLSLDRLKVSKWFVNSGNLYHVEPEAQKQVTVTVFKLVTGAKFGGSKLQSPWLGDDSRCAVTSTYLACVGAVDGRVYSSNLMLSEAADEVAAGPIAQMTMLTSLGELRDLRAVPGVRPMLLAVDKLGTTAVIAVGPKGLSVLDYKLTQPVEFVATAVGDDGDVLLHLLPQSNEILAVTALNIDNGKQVADLTSQLKYPIGVGKPAMVQAACAPRRERGVGCRFLIQTEDNAVILLHHPGKMLWVREEALTSVVAVEMLDLPVSDTDAAIEKEFDNKESGSLGMFVHRLISQTLQLRSFIMTLLGFGSPPSAGQRAGLVRDEFNLHKIIVVVTSVGKVFGIDNLSGEIIWKRYLEDVTTFTSPSQPMLLFVQRTTRHFPYPAQCALVAKHKVTGEGVLFTFNPFSGQGMVSNDGIQLLGYRVRQALLLPVNDENFLRALLLFDEKEKLHSYPDTGKQVAAQIAHTTFLFTAEPNTGTLTGYSLGFSTAEGLVATAVWEVKLCIDSPQKVIAVVGKNPGERVHSQGRVLADRSVLYKYINPNLVAVATQGFDPVQKYILNIYLVDAVSGAVVFSASHKRAREPVYVVHSENWVLYSYFSEKSRRTEIVTLELYEGKVQSNTTAFSSLSAPIQPIVDRQAYILPGNIEALKETITEKGITSKHILVALATGGILELPWLFVDPRRPVTVTSEMREEGVIPYMPELPIPPDAIINYNQTLQRIRGIHTAPSGLESTCLILAYGLDLFYTRVAPSKTFDLLKEDFDHLLITAVLLGLAVASYVTKKLASRKALKLAWK